VCGLRLIDYIVLLLVGSIVANLVTVLEFDLRAYPLLNALGHDQGWDTIAPPSGDTMANIYFLPWTRCAPYVVGIMAAFVLVEKGTTNRVVPFTRLIVMLVSFLLIVFLIFLPWTEANWGWGEAVSTAYLMFSRPLWAAGLLLPLLLPVANTPVLCGRITTIRSGVPQSMRSVGWLDAHVHLGLRWSPQQVFEYWHLGSAGSPQLQCVPLAIGRYCMILVELRLDLRAWHCLLNTIAHCACACASM
jgi:hypothetical protein